MQDLTGKVAVITGAASGIGRAMADRFAQAGMKIMLVDIDEAEGEKAAEEVRALGVDAAFRRVDVSDADAMDALAEATLEALGGVHVVCNNAGVGSGGPMWELTTKDWDFAIRPNLWGVIHGVRVFTKHLIAQNEGHIVNTASMAGLVSVPGMGPYNVTKHGVVTLSETLYGELEQLGSAVGVSVLCPGFVQTQIWNSERSRPDELKNEVPRYSEEEQENSLKLMKAILEQGIPAPEAAERVFEAVTSESFYIFTHEYTRTAAQQRFEGILNGDKPVLPAQGGLVFNE